MFFVIRFVFKINCVKQEHKITKHFCNEQIFYLESAAIRLKMR